MEEPRDAASAARPYRMAAAVFAKPELCLQLVPDILLDILRHSHRFMDGHAFSADITSNMGAVLQQLDATVVWRCVTDHLTARVNRNSAPQAAGEVCFCPHSYPIPWTNYQLCVSSQAALFLEHVLEKLLVHANPPVPSRLALLRAALDGMEVLSLTGTYG